MKDYADKDYKRKPNDIPLTVGVPILISIGIILGTCIALQL